MVVFRVLYVLLGTVIFFVAFYFEEDGSYFQQIENNLNDFNLYLTLLYGLVASIILNDLIDSGKKISKKRLSYYLSAFFLILSTKIIYNILQ